MPSRKSTPRQSVLLEAVAKGSTAARRANSSVKTPWATGGDLSSRARRTWYVSLKVRQDVRGDVSDLTLYDIDGASGSRVITLALLGVAPDGTIRGLTGAELRANFDEYLAQAIRRSGVIPAGKDAVKAVFRHKDR